MRKVWVVVAQRSDARFYLLGLGSKFRLIHQMHHPEGRLKDHEIVSDRQGRSGGTASVQRHGLSTTVTPSEQISIDFSKKIASFLDAGRKQERYEALILIASTKFLGLLAKNLTVATSRCVARAIGKNLGGLSDREISAYLREHLEAA
jgi:protein required for attachment to host cells